MHASYCHHEEVIVVYGYDIRHFPWFFLFESPSCNFFRTVYRPEPVRAFKHPVYRVCIQTFSFSRFLEILIFAF